MNNNATNHSPVSWNFCLSYFYWIFFHHLCYYSSYTYLYVYHKICLLFQVWCNHKFQKKLTIEWSCCIFHFFLQYCKVLLQWHYLSILLLILNSFCFIYRCFHSLIYSLRFCYLIPFTAWLRKHITVRCWWQYFN